MTEQRAEPRYRLDGRIATGGMGVVWRATDTVLDREVAVKVLKPEYADDPTFRSRFVAEARHAAALHHHNIASVFDFGELDPEDGSGVPRPYLVMELVPGEPLSALLRDGEPMPPETAAGLGAQAADALAAAHALGIVHRDVKPANLMVTPGGQVKITDFGIARAADGAALTQTGQVMGTPAYISPEQAEGTTATQASDIYSLGVVLYECLAGVRPFDGGTPVSTALAHLRDDPPPLPDHVPARLREVVTTALAKDPGHRFTSMADFAGALRGGPIRVSASAAATLAAGPAPVEADQPDATRVMTAAPAPAPARPARRHRPPPAWLPWAGAALGVLLVVTLLAWLGQGDEPAATADDGTDTPTAAASEKQPSSKKAAPAGIVIVADYYIGMDKDAAKDRLEDLGLAVKEEKFENLEDRPEDTVADISPTGEVQEGDEILLSVWDEPVVDQVVPDDDDGVDEKAPKGKGKAKGHKEKDD
ncbi:MAG: protein kinase domain-containing protein [Nocardioides sp.]